MQVQTREYINEYKFQVIIKPIVHMNSKQLTKPHVPPCKAIVCIAIYIHNTSVYGPRTIHRESTPTDLVGTWAPFLCNTQ